MVTIELERDIPASAGAVWETLRRFGDIYKVHPAVPNSYLTAGPEIGVGAERRCDFDPAGERFILERQIAFDDEARTQQVEVFGGNFRPPVRSVVAHFAVTPAGPEQSRITMRMELDGNPAQRLMAATVIRRKFRPVLESVLRGIEVYATTGEEVTGPESLAVLEAARAG